MAAMRQSTPHTNAALRHLLRGGCHGWCTASRYIPHAICFRMFFVRRPGGNAARVAGTVSHALVSENKSYRAIKHQDTCVKFMGVRFAMPVWFDFAFANLVTLLSEAGFKVGPVHYLYPSAVRSNRGSP